MRPFSSGSELNVASPPAAWPPVPRPVSTLVTCNTYTQQVRVRQVSNVSIQAREREGEESEEKGGEGVHICTVGKERKETLWSRGKTATDGGPLSFAPYKNPAHDPADPTSPLEKSPHRLAGAVAVSFQSGSLD